MISHYKIVLLIGSLVPPIVLVLTCLAPSTTGTNAAVSQPTLLRPSELGAGTYLVIVPQGKVAKLDLPQGAELLKVLDFGGQGMFHNGNRADTEKPTSCMGPIRQWLNDEGHVGYECIKCSKKWPPQKKGN